VTIPDFQTIMLPLMQIAADGQEHRNRDVTELLAQHFKFTDEERKALLPSGRQATFDNRVGWSATHLRKACLLERTGSGRFHITQRGLEVLQTHPAKIDMQLLLQFAEFRAFRERQIVDANQQPVAAVDEDNGQDPEEMLGASYQKVRQTLAQDVLDRVKGCTPRFFERLVVEWLVAMGYGGSLRDAGQAVGQSGDDGIDGIIKEDRLGLDVVYIQAKRWKGTVGRPVVQAFAGSLEAEPANKGVLITTSSFSHEAKDYMRRIQKKIVLIDGEQHAQFMIDHDVGVAHAATYVVKRIDSDYFEEA
jgi:restriction system protein